MVPAGTARPRTGYSSTNTGSACEPSGHAISSGQRGLRDQLERHDALAHLAVPAAANHLRAIDSQLGSMHSHTTQHYIEHRLAIGTFTMAWRGLARSARPPTAMVSRIGTRANGDVAIEQWLADHCKLARTPAWTSRRQCFDQVDDVLVACTIQPCTPRMVNSGYRACPRLRTEHADRARYHAINLTHNRAERQASGTTQANGI